MTSIVRILFRLLLPTRKRPDFLDKRCFEKGSFRLGVAKYETAFYLKTSKQTNLCTRKLNKTTNGTSQPLCPTVTGLTSLSSMDIKQ